MDPACRRTERRTAAITTTDTELMAYVDGELASARLCDIEAAISADPEARDKLEMFRQTSTMLKAACAESFYSTGLEHLRTLSAARALRILGRRFAVSAAACLIVGVAGFGVAKSLYGPASARDALLNEVAEYHEVFSRERAHLVEVPAENVVELQEWLGQRLGRKMPVPDLSTLGLRFAGGRMLVVDGKPVGEVMYTRMAGLPVAFCATPMSGTVESLRVDVRQGLRLASWTDGRHAYVVVGDLDERTAAGAAELAKAQFAG